MVDAVIVSTARTPIGRAVRGVFNLTHGADMGGHVIQHAVKRAGIDPALVEDVTMGCANPEGATGGNIARQAAIRAGLPVTSAGQTVNRFCSSGLQAIALAANAIRNDGVPVAVAGGLESISLVQMNLNTKFYRNEWIVEHKGALYMPMIETADIVAKRYGISRQAQDEYALMSQQRTAAGQKSGKFDQEIVPMTTVMAVENKETKEISKRTVTLERDEGNRPETNMEGLAKLKPVRGDDQFITAGNASQLSDGASACHARLEPRAHALVVDSLPPPPHEVARARHARHNHLFGEHGLRHLPDQCAHFFEEHFFIRQARRDQFQRQTLGVAELRRPRRAERRTHPLQFAARQPVSKRKRRRSIDANHRRLALFEHVLERLPLFVAPQLRLPPAHICGHRFGGPPGVKHSPLRGSAKGNPFDTTGRDRRPGGSALVEEHVNRPAPGSKGLGRDDGGKDRIFVVLAHGYHPHVDCLFSHQGR
jgi:acetyl-CoA acetyltransferase